VSIRERLRGGHQGDHGLSLAELLVTIMIFGIVLTVVTGTFVSLTRTTSLANRTDSNVRTASNGMNEVTRQIRSAVVVPVPGVTTNAPAFIEASTEGVTFTTAVNQTGSTNQPQLVRFSLAADRSLVENKTASVPIQSTYWAFTGAVTTRTLTGPVSIASAKVPVLFQYADSSGALLIPGATGKLAATQLAQIASVTVTLSVKSTSAYDNGVTLVNTVGLPNITATGPVS
jgi:prepilin-type N-terminal cleavage/methylation domain-containing protein